MTPFNRKLVLILPLLWLAVFGFLIASKQFIIQTGAEVTLKTVPVDPRDLFRGDYVTLRYSISNLDLSTIQDDGTQFAYGDTVYVSLMTVGRYAEPIMVSERPPSGTLYIKGRVVDAYANRITVEYGIESYFVPEGEGKPIEQARGNLDVKVAIADDGAAIITSVIIDGVEIDY